MPLDTNVLTIEQILRRVRTMLEEEGYTDHEQLDNLLGGNDDGHYHLTSDEWTKLLKVIQDIFVIEGDEVTLDHEKLANLLGGNANGHYHLTSDERNKINKVNPEAISEWFNGSKYQ